MTDQLSTTMSGVCDRVTLSCDRRDCYSQVASVVDAAGNGDRVLLMDLPDDQRDTRVSNSIGRAVAAFVASPRTIVLSG